MSIATRKARLDHEELEWMLTAERAGVHQQLGYSSFCQYLESVFGYTTRDAPALLQVAKRLAELPEVRAALRLGHQTWSGCRELSRVATAETESEWLAATADKNVRQIERMVSGLDKGDLPAHQDPKAASQITLMEAFLEDGRRHEQEAEEWHRKMKKRRESARAEMRRIEQAADEERSARQAASRERAARQRAQAEERRREARRRPDHTEQWLTGLTKLFLDDG